MNALGVGRPMVGGRGPSEYLGVAVARWAQGRSRCCGGPVRFVCGGPEREGAGHGGLLRTDVAEINDCNGGIYS